jgi:homoserine acetyltransferase
LPFLLPIKFIALVVGWSMGAGQTYQWAVSYPDMVERILPFCGSAKTSLHNIVFLVAFWEGFFLKKDANNLLAMLWTWQNGNIGNTPGFDGNFEKALGAIKAKAIVMPADIDLYFPPEDNEYEVKFMPNAEFRVIRSVWGHFAGGGVNPVDTQFIDAALKELLAS